MYKKRERIKIKALISGMVLAENLKLNNTNLLTTNTVLTDYHINKIKELYFVSDVYIYSDKQQKELKNIDRESIDNFEKIETYLFEISTDIERLFKEIHYSSKPNIREVQSLVKHILDKFNRDDYGILVKNMIMGRKIDEYLYRHSTNVAVLSSMIGKWIELSERDLMLLTYAALLHDIGKIKIDLQVLNKPSKLTEKEFKIIKEHSTLGYNIVRKIPSLDYSVALGVLMHHEKLDGTGYPLNLKMDNIHIFGKIIAIADIFDAMTSNRVYHRKEPPFKVLEMMREEAFGKLDFKCYTKFLTNISNYYIGEMIRLNTGQIGKIIKIDINHISKPLIMVDSNFIDLNNDRKIVIEELLV